jgi:hypothetical protein
LRFSPHYLSHITNLFHKNIRSSKLILSILIQREVTKESINHCPFRLRILMNYAIKGGLLYCSILFTTLMLAHAFYIFSKLVQCISEQRHSLYCKQQ